MCAREPGRAGSTADIDKSSYCWHQYYWMILFVTALAWARAPAANLAAAPTCGSCVVRGGAWCVDTSRCVPDLRGACSAPEQQVSVVGSGRCFAENDHQLATYLHAPRKNPLETLRRTAEPDAREMGCKTSATWCRDLQRLTGVQETAEEARKRLDICGLVLLGAAFDPIELRELRSYAASKLPLSDDGPEEDGAARSKFEIPGVRGDRRQEWILPHNDKIAATIVRGLRGRIDAVVGAAPRDLAIEMVSVIVSWPGAGAQAFHRDAAAASEAVSLVFIPLDAMPHNGPQFCPCSHVAGSPEVCQKSSAGRLPVPPELLPLGGAVLYDAGLVHRGLAYDAKEGGNGKARVLLHVSIAPRGAPLRSRPTALLGASAQEHIRRWRAHSLARDDAPSCAAAATCAPCLAVTGCAWCARERRCKSDLGGMCRSPESHIGRAGLGGTRCASDGTRLPGAVAGACSPSYSGG